MFAADTQIVDGKGGGKPTNAQGQGVLVAKVPEALIVGAEYAASKL